MSREDQPTPGELRVEAVAEAEEPLPKWFRQASPPLRITRSKWSGKHNLVQTVSCDDHRAFIEHGGTFHCLWHAERHWKQYHGGPT